MPFICKQSISNSKSGNLLRCRDINLKHRSGCITVQDKKKRTSCTLPLLLTDIASVRNRSSESFCPVILIEASHTSCCWPCQLAQKGEVRITHLDTRHSGQTAALNLCVVFWWGSAATGTSASILRRSTCDRDPNNKELNYIFMTYKGTAVTRQEVRAIVLLPLWQSVKSCRWWLQNKVRGSESSSLITEGAPHCELVWSTYEGVAACLMEAATLLPEG